MHLTPWNSIMWLKNQLYQHFHMWRYFNCGEVWSKSTPLHNGYFVQTIFCTFVHFWIAKIHSWCELLKNVHRVVYVKHVHSIEKILQRKSHWHAFVEVFQTNQCGSSLGQVEWIDLLKLDMDHRSLNSIMFIVLMKCYYMVMCNALAFEIIYINYCNLKLHRWNIVDNGLCYVKVWQMDHPPHKPSFATLLTFNQML